MQLSKAVTMATTWKIGENVQQQKKTAASTTITSTTTKIIATRIKSNLGKVPLNGNGKKKNEK